MYQRKGFDPEIQDWFWAVFRPDGNVVVNPKGMNMAGRIVGGRAMPQAPFNCIACHSAAPGDDMVFLHDAVLLRTIMNDAGLTGTRGLTADQLRLSCGNAETRLPDGLAIGTCPGGEMESILGPQ